MLVDLEIISPPRLAAGNETPQPLLGGKFCLLNLETEQIRRTIKRKRRDIAPAGVALLRLLETCDSTQLNSTNENSSAARDVIKTFCFQ